MNEVLLCSHNPILIKNVYGILRDEGFDVEVVDHSALAVQRVFGGNYVGVIIDSESFGLSAEDAARIIRSVSSDIVVICVGFAKPDSDVMSMKVPVDLEEFKQAIRDMRRCALTKFT
jgi:DNA-binding response OmpR family regulator